MEIIRSNSEPDSVYRSMKTFTTLTAVFLFFASEAAISGVTRNQVESGIQRSVIFSIQPNAQGRIGECHLVSVIDLKTKAQSAFNPSRKFINEACTVSLARGPNWIPEFSEDGLIKPVLETCMWSSVIPDSPICRVEIQARFADEIPLGVGYSAIFKLSTDELGHITSCRFDSMGELSRTPKPVDIKPHDLFVSDACRKLSSVEWKPEPKEFFMYCRYVPANPVRAFCEKRFGE